MNSVLLASVLLIGISILIIAAQRMLADIAYDHDTKVIGALRDAVSAELSLADTQPVGYSRQFTLPYTFEGAEYSVLVQSETEPAQDAFIILYKGNSFFWFARQNVTGTILPGQNLLRKTSTGIILN